MPQMKGTRRRRWKAWCCPQAIGRQFRARVQAASMAGRLSRNGTDSVYAGSEARKSSVQKRMDNKPSPKLDDHTLTREIMSLLKQDLSVGRISGRFEVLCPDRRGKRASPSTVYAYLYGEAVGVPALRERFRQKR
jgi:IS30 family transposase